MRFARALRLFNYAQSALVPVAFGLRVVVDYWGDQPVFELIGPELGDPAGIWGEDLIWVLANGGTVQAPGYPERVELPEPEGGAVYLLAHRRV